MTRTLHKMEHSPLINLQHNWSDIGCILNIPFYVSAWWPTHLWKSEFWSRHVDAGGGRHLNSWDPLHLLKPNRAYLTVSCMRRRPETRPWSINYRNKRVTCSGPSRPRPVRVINSCPQAGFLEPFLEPICGPLWVNGAWHYSAVHPVVLLFNALLI